MSDETSLYVNYAVEGGIAHLLRLSPQGMLFAFGPVPAVTDWSARIRSGDEADTVTAPFSTIPWGSIDWLEWSDDVDVRFQYTIAGFASQTMKFEAESLEQRDAIAADLRALRVFRASEHQKAKGEIVRGPAATLAGLVGVGALLLWALGQQITSGGGRTAARKAIVVAFANVLGPAGIVAITLLGVAGVVVYTLRRLRNPPIVHRLEHPASVPMAAVE
jgi:hypothetical protein